MNTVACAQQTKYGSTYPFVHDELANILSSCIFPEQLEHLSVMSFSEHILTIMKQLYAVMYKRMFSDCSGLTYKLLRSLNPIAPNEAIFFDLTPQRTLIHIFNVAFIAKFFNNRTNNYRVVKSHGPSLSSSSSKYVLKDNAVYSSQLLSDTDTDDCIYVGGDRLNDLQMTNLIKLLLLCDHALEHVHTFIEGGSFGYNHKNFGSNIQFLSSIITPSPNKQMERMVRHKHAQDLDRVFTSSFTLTHDDDDDDDDDTSTDSG